jgi:pimeloyl-ACP methyl ester carboxylesterase/uncharacterized protein YjbI with pentapeptide repeats
MPARVLHAETTRLPTRAFGGTLQSGGSEERMNRVRLVALALLTLALDGCASSEPQRSANGKRAFSVRESFEPAPEFGGSVYVLEAGPVDAPPLVLVHGFGERAARDFDPIVSRLSEQHRVLAFDLPGFGRSTHAAEVYSPARYVRFLRALIARHFSGPVDLLGHSMGGALAIQYAADYPQDVRRLALLDVAGILQYRDYLIEVNAGDPAQQNALAVAWSGAREVLLRLALSVTSLEALASESDQTAANHLSPQTAAAIMFISHDFGPVLRRVRAPTWIGWGRHDSVAPRRTAEVLRFVLKPVRDEIFENSAHVPMQTEPERLAQSLLSFLALPARPELPDVAPVPSTFSARNGNCIDRRDRLFEGEYDRIRISGCKRVLLRRVHARSLWIEHSEVELEHVEITGQDVGVTFAHSHIRWTGGRIVAPVCVESDSNHLNFAGVSCQATRDSLRVRGRGHLLASVSALELAGAEQAMHGDYVLARTADGDTPRLSEREHEWMQSPNAHSTTRIPPTQLAGKTLPGEMLAGAQLEGADLEGTNLIGADLSRANLRRAQLRRSKLREAKLMQADLRGAAVTNAHVERADLRGADLRETNFEESDLSDADLRGANLEGAKLAGARLTGALYDAGTTFSAGFAPDSRGLVRHEATTSVAAAAAGL